MYICPTYGPRMDHGMTRSAHCRATSAQKLLGGSHVVLGGGLFIDKFAAMAAQDCREIHPPQRPTSWQWRILSYNFSHIGSGFGFRAA